MHILLISFYVKQTIFTIFSYQVVKKHMFYEVEQKSNLPFFFLPFLESLFYFVFTKTTQSSIQQNFIIFKHLYVFNIERCLYFTKRL